MNKRNRVMEIFYRFMSGEHMAVKDLAAEYEERMQGALCNGRRRRVLS